METQEKEAMIKVNCKTGVWFKFINIEFLWAAQVVCRVFEKYNVSTWITSACDSKHASNSFHYDGMAWDFRIWGVDNPQTPQDEVMDAAKLIRAELHTISPRFRVIYGDPQHLDHIHVEFNTRL